MEIVAVFLFFQPICLLLEIRSFMVSVRMALSSHHGTDVVRDLYATLHSRPDLGTQAQLPVNDFLLSPWFKKEKEKKEGRKKRKRKRKDKALVPLPQTSMTSGAVGA